MGRTTQYSVFQCMSTIPVGQGPAEPHISHKPPNRTQTQKTTPHQKDELFLIFASHPSYTKTHTSECSPNPRLNKHHHYTHHTSTFLSALFHPPNHLNFTFFHFNSHEQPFPIPHFLSSTQNLNGMLCYARQSDKLNFDAPLIKYNFTALVFVCEKQPLYPRKRLLHTLSYFDDNATHFIFFYYSQKYIYNKYSRD